MSKKELHHDPQNGMTRREMLKLTALAGGGLALGASGVGAAYEMLSGSKEGKAAAAVVPFYGAHQSGIVTPHQSYGYLAAFDIDGSVGNDVSKVMALFIRWSQLTKTLTAGKREANSRNPDLPPNDTNEARELGPANLTITFGLGYSFFLRNGNDRFGLAKRLPKQLTPMPKLAHETLDPAISNGDICVQVCADVQQVAFHALRNLTKEAVGTANLRWMESGFLSKPKKGTPRNLFGFKDGTANIEPSDVKAQKRVIWTGDNEPRWMRGGTYLGYRKIRMNIETWDRDSFRDQENVFGRKKDTGAPFGRTHEKESIRMDKLPTDSHVYLNHKTGREIFRRPFSYTNGIDPATGHLNAGLLFIAFQNKPQDSFIHMLRILGRYDALNEYIDHIATGLFAIAGGIRKGEYVCQHLFE